MILAAVTFLSKAGKYFLFGNIFISVCAFSLFWATCLLIQFPLPLTLGVWVGLATFFLYNFDSLLPTKLRYHVAVSPRKAWVLAHRRVLAIAMIAAGLLLVFIFLYSFRLAHFWLLAHLALLSLFYSWPVIPTANGFIPLRNVPLLKLLLISYVWATVTVWLPLLAANWPVLAGKGWLLFLERFFFILPLTIIFDIRDVARDQHTGTLTLPRLVGVRAAKWIAFTFLLAYLLLVFFNHQGANQLALILCGLIYGGLIELAHENRSEYFYAVAGDGILVMPAILLLLLTA